MTGGDFVGECFPWLGSGNFIVPTATRFGGLVSAGLLLAACAAVNEEGGAAVATARQPVVAARSNTAVLASREQFESYSKVLVEPVAITVAPAEGAAADGDAVKIADYFRTALFHALSNRYGPTEDPGTDVLSIRATISGRDESRPAEPGPPSNGDAADPQAEVPAGRSADHVLAGSVLQAEVTDSVSHERLATMRQPVPAQADLSQASWSDVKQILDDWALRLATTLAAARPAG